MILGASPLGSTAIGAAYVVRPGPSFALVVPTQYVVHLPKPDSPPHLQGSGHDPVAGGTEVVLALIVFLIVGRQVVVRFIRENVPRTGPAIP